MPAKPVNRLMPALRRVVLAGSINDRTDGQLLGAFVADRDADAFAGLVRRHGPMVLGVCRRVTGDHTTADDAFQAVFLVLARRAAAIKPREQVGNWLYGVAYRTAIKARAVLARQRSREKQVNVMPEPPVPPPDVWSDLQPVIDEELARLPDKLRMPIVLCDLEGRTQREVARHLAVPPATLATRLATARRTLAQRLTKRGVTLSGGALAALLTAHGTAAAVSQGVAYSLAQAAEAIAGGSLASSLVSPHAIQLSEGVVRMMFLNKLKTVAVAVLTAATLSCGMGLGLLPAAAGEDPAPAAKHAAAVAPLRGNVPVKATEIAQLQIVLNERNLDVSVDDETFLKRLIHDLRGDLPTPVETWFFVSDRDSRKRAKVFGWVSADKAIVARIAEKLGVVPEEIQVVRFPAATSASDGEQKNQEVVHYKVYRKVRTESLEASANNSVDFNPGQDTADSKKIGVGVSSSIELFGNVTIDIGKDTEEVTRVAGDAYVRDSILQPRAKVVEDWEPALQLVVDSQLVMDMQLEISANSDIEFLRRVLHDVRGTPPTSLEEKYFSEDKDPKKREKLLDTLLKDPAVTKKLGESWKKKMLEGTQHEGKLELKFIEQNGIRLWKVEQPKAPQPPAKPKEAEFFFKIVPAPKAPEPPAKPAEGQFFFKIVPGPNEPQPPAKPPAPPAKPKDKQKEADFYFKIVPEPKAPQPVPPPKPKGTDLRVEIQMGSPAASAQSARLEKLVGELLAAKKTDAEMLEAVTLATVSRLPTDTEKRLTLGLVAKTTDRRAAWLEVAKALAGTDEGAKPGKTEWRVTPKVIEFVPLPQAKP